MAPPQSLQKTRLPTVDLVLLVVVVLAAGLFRFSNLDWDAGRHLHPGENELAAVLVDRLSLSLPPDVDLLLDPSRSTLNPRSIDPLTGLPRSVASGSFPLYVVDCSAAALTAITGVPWWDRDHVHLLGRAFSALADTLSVVLVYLLGRRLHSSAAGLLAAAFTAVCVLHIQNAHFFTADAWLPPMLLGALLCASGVMFNCRTRYSLALGALFGLALSTTMSALPFALVVVVAHLYRAPGAAAMAGIGERGARKHMGLASSFATTAIVFVLLQPYAVLDSLVFFRDMAEQATRAGAAADLARGRYPAPTVPLAYLFQNLLLWGAGLPLGLTALGGVVYFVARWLRQRGRRDLLLLAWVVPYLFILGTVDAGSPKYLLPVLPVMFLMGAAALRDLRAAARRLRPVATPLSLGLWISLRRRLSAAVAFLPALTVVLILIAGALWSVAFIRVYDPSLTSYDHPHLYLFKKVSTVDDNTLRQLFSGLAGEDSHLMEVPTARPIREVAVGDLPAVPDYAWNFPANESELLAILFWVAAIELVGLAALPLTLLLFQGLRDRGYPLAKITGTVVLSYLVWLWASVGVLNFTVASVAGSLLLIMAVSAACVIWRRKEMWEFVRCRWKLLAIGEIIFAVSFGAFILLRLADPGLWHPLSEDGGFADLALVNSMLRSGQMPPYDPWFAGAYVDGAYFAQFIVATLVKLTGIRLEVAYNMAVPLFFALTATAAFSVTYNLSSRIMQRRPDEVSARAVIVGLAGALFVAVAGSIQGAGELSKWLSGDRRGSVLALDYWLSGWVATGPSPFFTFLDGDLGARVVVLPILLLSIAIALNLALDRRKPSPSGLRAWRQIAPSMLAGSLALGTLLASNPWDAPVSLGILATGLIIRFFPHQVTGHHRQLLAVAGTALVGVLGWLLFRPSVGSSSVPILNLQLAVSSTTVSQYFLTFGLFLFVLVTAVFFLARDVDAMQWGKLDTSSPAAEQAEKLRSTVERGIMQYTGTDRSPNLPLHVLLAGAVAVASAAGLVFNSDAALSALLAVLLVFLACAAVALPLRADHRFVIAMSALAIGVSLACEFLDPAGSGGLLDGATTSMVYHQVWVLLALAAAASLPLLAGWLAKTRLASLWWVGLEVLLLASLVHPVLGTAARLQDFPPTGEHFGTLDGSAYLQSATVTGYAGQTIPMAPDGKAINWLRRNVGGTPVILEASIGPLDGHGSRVSSATGLPTVLGWHTYEQRRRSAEEVERRLRDVREVYNSTNVSHTLALLRKYRVSYIYVGPIERYTTLVKGLAGATADGEHYAGPEGLEKLESMIGEYLEVVYDVDGVTIYRVKDEI